MKSGSNRSQEEHRDISSVLGPESKAALEVLALDVCDHVILVFSSHMHLVCAGKDNVLHVIHIYCTFFLLSQIH